MLRPYRWRLALAVVAFGIKDSPVWLLPVITGAVIDIVVNGGPVSGLIWIAGGSVLLLAIHFPMHLLFVRLFFGSSRALGAQLRNGLTSRLQSLSIGFHSRSNAAVIQTKVVRDVENVELLFQQAFPPALTALFSLIGAITMTALAVPTAAINSVNVTSRSPIATMHASFSPNCRIRHLSDTAPENSSFQSGTFM